MKTPFKHILLLIGILLISVGCSTKKNTWMSRNYQALNVKYNVHFNGFESFKSGLQSINRNHVDDYSEVLLMFPISYHPNASAGMGDMERAIEKSKKAIKTRSIKKKPKRNPKKMKNPEYVAFYNQEEFNVMIDDAWLLQGKAEFYKTDFLAAAATFTYITRHFSSNKDVVSEAQIWLARSYAEMGWLYEAADILNRANKDGFSKKQNTFFAAVSADLLLKEGQYKEAIPFLKLAIDGEKNKKQRTRFQFILGQLYEMQGDKKNAFEMFSAVVKSNPPFEMELNARLRKAENHVGSDEDMLKMLAKMAKDSKNQDYLDQIYAAIGNIHKQQGNTDKAIENYKLSIEKSTRGGYEKAQSLILLADLYYEKEKFMEAQPYYSEAVALMNPASSDFRRVNVLAQTLSELARYVEVVTLQDSLQMLSKLPEREQMAKINELIKRVIAEEAEAKKKAEEERKLAESSFGAGSAFSNNTQTNMMMSLGQANASFYFYNPQLLTAGKTDFQRKWGTRRLEDNWRRQVKTAVIDVESNEEEEKAEELSEEAKAELAALNDNKKPEFYLRQLFTAKEQFEASDAEIMDALYNIGFIYNDKIGSTPKAIQAFEELERRFPSFEKLPDVYFYLYQTYVKQNDKAKADLYRTRLISQFPDSKYAQMLSQPDYEDKLRRMAAEQDSLYEKTYSAYLASDFEQVLYSYRYMSKNYPASYLMPKFALLHSLSIAKTDTPENFKISLEELIERYPDSDVTTIAKDMLALLSQGQESQIGGSHGNLIALREQESTKIDESNEELNFKVNAEDIHYFVIHAPKGSVDLNRLQFNIAAYNFTKFLIKDFDIEIRRYDEEDFIIVRNLEGLEEALWYQSGIMADNFLSSEIRNNNLTYFVISKENFGLIFSRFTVEDYIKFYNNNIAGGRHRINNNVVSQLATPAGQATIVNVQQEVTEVKPEYLAPEKPAVQEQPVQITQTKLEVKPEPAQPKPEPVQQPKEEPVQPKPVEPKKEESVQPKLEPVQPKKEEPVQPKPEEKPAPALEEKKQEEAPAPAPTVVPPPEAPKKDLPKFKGLYTFDETAKHYFALYVLSGSFDFEQVKAALDKYNSENYPLMNLQVTQANSGKNKVILVGMLPDAASATSYLMRIVKDRSLFTGMQSAVFRNLIITEENLKTLDRVGNPTVYLEFLREFYLK